MTEQSYESRMPDVINSGLTLCRNVNFEISINNMTRFTEDFGRQLGTALNSLVQTRLYDIDEKLISKEENVFRHDKKLMNLNHGDYRPYIYTNYPNMYKWMVAMSLYDDLLLNMAIDKQILGCWYVSNDIIDLLRMVHPTKWSNGALFYGDKCFGKFVNSFYMIFDYFRARYSDHQLGCLFSYTLSSFIKDRITITGNHCEFLSAVMEKYRSSRQEWTGLEVEMVICRLLNAESKPKFAFTAENLTEHADVRILLNDNEYLAYMVDGSKKAVYGNRRSGKLWL